MEALAPGGRSFMRAGLGRHPAAWAPTFRLPIGLKPRPDLGISRHFGQIPQPRRVQPLQEGRGIAISLVAHHPTGWDPLRGYDLLDQLSRQFVFGLKRDVFGNPAIPPQCPVILTKPGLRQIETPVK